MSHPQAVRRRQIAKARATNARDRMLAGVTYGARGGIVGGLGALNTATNTVGGLTGGARRPVLVRGGVIEGGGQTPIQIASNHAAGLPPRTILPVKPTVIGTNQVAAAVAALPGIRVITPYPSKPGTKLPGSRPAPTPLPEPVSPVKTGSGSGSSGSSGGGGGGGGGSSGSSSGTTLPEYTDAELPDVDETTVDAPAAKMSTGKMLAIGGGIVAALYLLLNGED